MKINLQNPLDMQINSLYYDFVRILRYSAKLSYTLLGITYFYRIGHHPYDMYLLKVNENLRL